MYLIAMAGDLICLFRCCDMMVGLEPVSSLGDFLETGASCG